MTLHSIDTLALFYCSMRTWNLRIVHSCRNSQSFSCNLIFSLYLKIKLNPRSTPWIKLYILSTVSRFLGLILPHTPVIGGDLSPLSYRSVYYCPILALYNARNFLLIDTQRHELCRHNLYAPGIDLETQALKVNPGICFSIKNLIINKDNCHR